MPGDSASAMPGATLACAPPTSTGSASCTIAINIKIAPLANPTSPVALIPGLHPTDIQRTYALPATNSGGTVAIVDAYDDPTAESDLAVYRAAFALPPCTIANHCLRKVDQRGGTMYPAPNLGWSQEIALDLDMVSAVCPRCSILLVEANSSTIDDLGAAVDTAAALGARVISNSYYATEWSNETSEDVHYHHPGVAITASAGDAGWPSYPAVSQYVLSVGGTTLSSASETAWPYSGHGCSTYISLPWWQPAACDTRSAVDVVAVGDPQTGVSMFDAQAGGWLVAGGTSVGAPIVAAAYALSGRFEGPAFSYAHPTAFHSLGADYNSTTGLGSLNGVAGL